MPKESFTFFLRLLLLAATEMVAGIVLGLIGFLIARWAPLLLQVLKFNFQRCNFSGHLSESLLL